MIAIYNTPKILLKSSNSSIVVLEWMTLCILNYICALYLLVFSTHSPQPPPSCGGRRHADVGPYRWCKTSCRFGSSWCCRWGPGGRPWRWGARQCPRSRLWSGYHCLEEEQQMDLWTWCKQGEARNPPLTVVTESQKMCVRSTRSEEYVACGGVPGDDADAFGVSLQDHDGIGDGAGQWVIWDLPHLERRDEGKSEQLM